MIIYLLVKKIQTVLCALLDVANKNHTKNFKSRHVEFEFLVQL